MFISVSSFMRSCVIVMRSLFLINFSLLDDISLLQLLIVSTRYDGRAVSTLVKVSRTTFVCYQLVQKLLARNVLRFIILVQLRKFCELDEFIT